MRTWSVGALEEVVRGERSSVGGERREREVAVKIHTQQVKNYLLVGKLMNERLAKY